MSNNIIKLVRGDDGSFLNQVFLVVYFKTNLNLDNCKMRLTVENPTNLIQMFEIHNNAVEVDLNKILSSTLEVATHRCNIKLYDTLNRVKTVKNFEIKIEDEFDTTYKYPNEYELEVVLDDGINKYKNYNELIDSTKPLIQGVKLEGDKSFQDLGLDRFTIDISNKGIGIHNKDEHAHFDIREQIFNKQDRLIAGSNITIIDGIISSRGAEGGITTDYKELGNKPKVNGVVLDGDITLDELGVQSKGEYVTEEILNQKGYLTSVPTGYITEEELESYNYLQEIPEEYFTDEQNEQKYAQLDELQHKQDVLTAGENIAIEKSEDETETIISASIPDNYITEEKLQEYNYTTGDRLNTLLNKKQNTLLAGDNIRLYKNIDGTYTISALDSKSISTINSYNALDNKPTINNILLTGNKTLDDLGIQPKGEYQNKLTTGENIDITEDNIVNVIIPDYLCTDEELENALITKANVSNTLNGYNIEDAYTKDEVEELIFDNNKKLFNDIIIDAPNGVANYTENSITIKEGLDLVFANNSEYVLDNDIVLDFSNTEYSEKYKNFYLAIQEIDNTLSGLIIPRESIKTVFVEKIPLTETGYIKNLFNGNYYIMEDMGHGINMPRKINIKLIGEGIGLNYENLFKIQNFTPYNIVNGISLDELLLQEKKFQEKLSFGENFFVKNNNVEYRIPFNYVTKEYLIENDYATQTNIDDAVRIHNTNEYSHQDLRNTINNLTSSYSYVSSRLNSLTSNIERLTRRVEELERKVR